MYPIFMGILGPLTRLKVRHISGNEHIPQTGPVIFCANHQGFFDAPALAATIYRFRPEVIHFLTWPLFWWLWGGPIATHSMGMIRLNNRDKAGSLQRMINIVRAGKVAAIFPEGERNHHPERLLPGKTGAVRMALATHVPVIPVGIRNRTGMGIVRAFSSFLRRDADISITFGTAVNFSDLYNQPVDRALLHRGTERLMQAIGDLVGVPPASQ